MRRYGAAIDIGGTTSKLGIFSEEGALLKREEIPTDKTDGGLHILPDAAAALLRMADRAGIKKEQLLGAGVGVPGPADRTGVTLGCGNLGWGRRDVRAETEGYLHVPVFVGNDADVAALGEMWQGGGAGYRDVLLVTIGTGVGAGIVTDGHLLFGAHGAGGEIGHMTVNLSESETCSCGRRGCLEQYASATGIVRLAKRNMKEADPSDIAALPKKGEESTAKDLFDAAKAGNAFAVSVTKQAADILGRALSNVTCVMDPQVIVLGGGVSSAGPYWLNAVREAYRAQAYFACRDTHFALAKLGNDAGLYGCMKMISGA